MLIRSKDKNIPTIPVVPALGQDISPTQTLNVVHLTTITSLDMTQFGPRIEPFAYPHDVWVRNG